MSEGVSASSQGERKNSGWTKMVDPDFDPEEEKLLDQKFDSVWQPSWAGESRCWRLFVRGAVLGLAIALLWLTSLTLATTIAGIYVAAPTYSEAESQWSFAAQIAQQENANAGACVDREVATCGVVLNESYNAMMFHGDQVQLQNGVILQAEANQASFCQKSWDSAILATSNLLKKVLFNISIYSNGTVNSTCTNADVIQLKNLLGDVSQQKSDVYLKNVQYSRDSNSFLGSAAASAKNRTDYDAWYIHYKFGWLGNWSFDLFNMSYFHIGDIDAQVDAVDLPIQDIISCVGMSGVCNYNISMANIYASTKEKADETYNSTRDDFDNFASRVSAFNLTVHNYFNSVDAMIGVLRSVANTAAQVFATLNLPDPFPSGVDFPDWRNLPAIGALPNIPLALNIPTAAEEWAKVSPVLNQILPGVDDAKQKVHDAAVRWMTAINDSIWMPDLNLGFNIPNYFSDYNPPPIHIDTAGFSSVTASFLESSRLALDGFNSIGSVNFTYNGTKADFQALIEKLPSFSSFSLMSSPFSGDISFYNLFASIGSIMFLLISADIIYRVFSSVSIVRKYTRMSELGLPVIDIREFEAAKQSANPTLAMYQLCTSPLILVGILAVVGLVIIGVLISLYVPMYIAYREGCVDSNNGTFITRNAYAFAYNYAASDANSKSGKGLSAYDKQSSEYCDAAKKAFNDQQTSDENNLATFRNSYDQNAADLALFQRCIVPSALPQNDSEWMNLTQYVSPYNPTVLLGRLECDRPGVYVTAGLYDNTADCTKLPPCNLTCTGPDQQALAAVTYDSGCITEWTFHAGLFRALLGLLVFVCINISRVLLMTAVIRLSWRQLTSKGFEFQGTCTKLGTTLDLEAKLKVAVDKAIKKYEWGAIVMLVFAVLIHIPYLVVLNKYGNATSQSVHP